jgi:preprotein translocase subunit SecE
VSGVRVSQPVQNIIKMSEIVKYFKDSYNELKNFVSWPSFNEGMNLTILVAVFSIIFSLVIWGLDSVFSRVIKEFFNLMN